MTEPRIALLVTTYNSAAQISELVSSIRRLNPMPDHVVFVDDASTDETVRNLRQHSASLSIETTVVARTNNGGSAAARNTALENTTAPLVSFLDGDDLVAADRFNHLVDVARYLPGAAAYFTPLVLFSSGRVTAVRSPQRHRQGWVARSLQKRNSIPFSTLTVDRRFHDIRFDDRIRSSEDWVAIHALARVAPVQLIRRPAALYRVHSGAKSGDTAAKEAAIIAALARIAPAASAKDIRRTLFALRAGTHAGRRGSALAQAARDPLLLLAYRAEMVDHVRSQSVSRRAEWQHELDAILQGAE